MTTATSTVTEGSNFLERMKARTTDDTMRSAITSFATSYLNGGNNILRLGLEIGVKDLVRCQWKHEPTKANANKYGYKLGKTKRGDSTDEVIYFPNFNAYIVDMSPKLIEFKGIKSDDLKERKLQPLKLGDNILNPYDRVGVIYNADGTKGAQYDLYNELRDMYPGAFTSRRFIMLILADDEGNQLHDIPLILSVKGGALRYLDEAIRALQFRMGLMLGDLFEDEQNASPMSIKGLRGFLLNFQCEEGDSDNGIQSSPVTAVKSIGAEITADNAEKFFSAAKEDATNAWAVANPDFIAAYDKQVSQAIGTEISQSFLTGFPEQRNLALPEETLNNVA